MGKIKLDRIVDSNLLDELIVASNDLEYKYLTDVLSNGRNDYTIEEEVITDGWLKYWKENDVPYLVVERPYNNRTHRKVYKLRRAVDCMCDVGKLRNGNKCKCSVFVSFHVP